MGSGPGTLAGAGNRRPAAHRVRNPVTGVRRWQVWTLRPAARLYVVGLTLVTACVAAFACARTSWRASDVALAAVLVACAFIAAEAARQVRQIHGGIVRDLGSVWLLPAAILLPPAYALVMPFLIAAYKIVRVLSSVAYRRLFSGATLSLAYGAVSVVFRALPASVAGIHPGTGVHALTWTTCVAACGMIGSLVNHGLLIIAIRLYGPGPSSRDLAGGKDARTADGVELSFAVVFTVVVAINPLLIAFGLPTVLLFMRLNLRAQWAENMRLDAGTGLLNATAWRREAEFEVSGAVHAARPLAITLVSIDDLAGKPQQLTIARAVREQLIGQVAAALKEQLPGDAVTGRLGDEEFAIVQHDGPGEARRTAERLRDHITAVPFEVDIGEASYVFRLTVSVGIAVLNESRAAALDELVEAADTALGQARAAGGRIRVAASAAEAS